MRPFSTFHKRFGAITARNASAPASAARGEGLADGTKAAARIAAPRW